MKISCMCTFKGYFTKSCSVPSTCQCACVMESWGGMSHVVLMGVRGGKDMKKGIIRKGKARKGKKKTDASLVSLKVRRTKGVPIIISSGKVYV